MAKKTGKDLAFMVGATPATTTALAVQRGWNYEQTVTEIDATAAGDLVIDREPLRYDYTVEFNGLLEIASPYVLPIAIFATKAAWAAQLDAADDNGIVSGVGLFNRFRIEAVYDGVVAVSGAFVAAGTQSTWDLSPAT